MLDDDLMREAGKYSAARSKRGIVAEALATYVAVKSEEQRRLNYRERLAGVRSRLTKTGKKRTPAQELIRADRDRVS